MKRCFCACHEYLGTYPTTRQRPCNICGHVNSDGHFPGTIREGWELTFSTNEILVLGVLREHPRSISTIAWGVAELTGDALPEPDALQALESLEQKGLARTSPLSRVSLDTNNWWVITEKGKDEW